MTRPAPKGWCPGAWRPMASGDGLIVRVRPWLGRLTAAQALGLCATAARHGNGVVELTSRANIQIRGLSDATLEAALAGLDRLGLLDDEPETEARRNVIVAPLWQPGDEADVVAQALTARLRELPDLPAKFGFAVDTGPERLLAGAPADVRIERGAGGRQIVRPDGAPSGRPTGDAVESALALARWFSAARGAARRMRDLAPPAGWAVEPPVPARRLEPGLGPVGPVVGVPFGSVLAAELAETVRQSGAVALRLAPGRLILLEGARAGPAHPLLTAPGNPLLSVDACPGAPACASATVETRGLARALAGRVADLHVSGCAKGCARQSAARVTLVGREGGFDLVRDGRAWDRPARRGMSREAVLAEADRF